MTNYRYSSPDYARRNSYGRQMSSASSPQMGTTRQTCTGPTVCEELSGMPLAMAYVPWQKWQHLYEVEKGFCRGTIFEELDKPFQGIGGCQNVR